MRHLNHEVSVIYIYIYIHIYIHIYAFEAETSKMILHFDGSHPSHILHVKRLVAHFEKRVHDELEAKKKDDS